MEQQHHPYDNRGYSKGANRDIDDELLDKADGQYIDACNMRTVSMDGDNAGIKKISGEVVFYPNIDNRCDIGTGLPLSSAYECLWVSEINQHIVEFWADGAHIEPSLIRVDGLIVLMSDDFPIDVDYPLQGAKNEACIGGEIYITDFHVVPMIFNIKDLLLNSGVDVGTETGECTDKYFDGFNLEEHLLIVTRTLEHPVFIKLDAGTAGYDHIFGSAGLPVGYVTYSFRSVSAVGDRTAWSAATPQIPVVKKVDSDCENYPWSKTISKDPDISSPSIYGAHIRFRINNEGNYDFIEIRRDSWVAGDPLGTPASSELVGVIDIVDEQFGVVNIIDRGGVEETLSPEDITSVMSAVERAKAIRYFNNKLYLMNVEYASRDITETLTMIGEDTGDTAFPSIQKIFKEGHSDPWKATYYKSTMRGEKNGYAILLWDEQGQWSYAKPINGATNFQVPNRREPTSALTEGTSYYGTVKAANVNGVVGQTHEVFDLERATAKDNKCLYANIMDIQEGKAPFDVNNPVPDCPTSGNEGLNTIFGVSAEKIGFRPFTPVSQDSDDCRHLDYVVNLKVENVLGQSVDYEPEGFEPDYYSAGVAFHGVDELPSWAKAMSIVRTEPAERIIAQGLGYYQLRSAEGALGANTGKETKEFAVYLPDLDEVTGLNPDIIEAIQIDPSSYAIQLVSPVGFFSEVFSFDNADGLQTRDGGVDFVTYCRILTDNGQINPNENPSMGIDDGGGDRYVSYGKWRASSQFANVFAGGANGNQLFDIDDVTEYTSSSARQKYFIIRTTSDFYAEANAGGHYNGDQSDVQDFHEPIYIINIVKKVADVPDTNITQYKYTGHYQKLDSVVGISDGSVSQNYELTDERWEDCIPTLNAQVQNDYDALERFVFVRDTFNNEKRWLNVTNKSAIDTTTILTGLQTNGFYDITDASGTYTVYGVYKHSQGVDFTAEEFFLNFSQFDTNFNAPLFLPDTESKIIVKYDKRIPMRVFGGDTWINESTWAVKDKVLDSGAEPVNNVTDSGNGQGDVFKINIAFPYRRYHLNPRIYIVNKTKAGLNPFAFRIQGEDIFKFNNQIGTAPASIRQLIAMWTAETRINLSFAFNDEVVKHSSDQYFPLKNYVMRPYNWDDDEFGSGAAAVYDDNNIWEDYETVYGDEFNLWGHGGFRFLPQTNIDYSKDDNTKGFSSVPKVGFEEQSLFCTRVIWSERRPINVQDTPSVRTFPSQNFYDISDDTGEIKRAYSAHSSKGNNLYAFTDSGLALLLVDKRIISEINANELATAGSDIGGILNELWINRSIGMADEMWRSAAEYSNSIWWTNYNSAYKMTDNNIQDIGRVGYHSKIYPEYLEVFGRGYDEKVTGVYDFLHNEYWVNFSKGDVIEEEIEFGEGTEHAINDQLDVVDMAYDIPLDPNDQIVGTNPNETVLITSALGLPPFIYLGGNANNMLTHSISICMIPDVIGAQSVEVRYRDENSNIIVLVTINAGECYCFTPSYSVPENPPTWTAEECNPFGMDDSPFDNYECPTLVWGETQGMWQGGFDYNFDKYLSFDNKTYGMRDMETYLLDEGRIINNELIEAHVISSSSVYARSSMNSYSRTPDKEFVRIRINSDTKPVRVEFFNDLNQLLSNNVQAALDTIANPLHLKNYYGYEQYIPRKTDTPFNRMQGRLLVFKIIHNLDEDFRITSTDVQYKGLK